MHGDADLLRGHARDRHTEPGRRGLHPFAFVFAGTIDDLRRR